VGKVIAVIKEHAITLIPQDNFVACYQSQRGAQGNDFPTPSSRSGIPSSTNNGAVYFKKDPQNCNKVRFNSREMKMVNPRDWNCEYPQLQIKRISFV